MKNIIDFSKTRLKALQRFRKGKGRWGIYQGHFFVLNPDQTAICFIRPREFDASKGASVNFSPWAAPLHIGNYDINLETGEIVDTIKGEIVEIGSKPITSPFMDPYLYPWKHKESAAYVAAPRVGVGTAKLAMQTFEAFGIEALTMDFHSTFQFWEGYSRDTVLYIVTMGVR